MNNTKSGVTWVNYTNTKYSSACMTAGQANMKEVNNFIKHKRAAHLNYRRQHNSTENQYPFALKCARGAVDKASDTTAIWIGNTIMSVRKWKDRRFETPPSYKKSNEIRTHGKIVKQHNNKKGWKYEKRNRIQKNIKFFLLIFFLYKFFFLLKNPQKILHPIFYSSPIKISPSFKTTPSYRWGVH